MFNECRHIFTSGKKCGSPALKNENFCFYHTTARKLEKQSAGNRPYDGVDPKETTLSLPTLDDPDSIQLAISEVVLALAANCIDPRRARILLYGLQIASQHYRNKQGASCKPAVGLSGIEDIVRETFPQDGIEIGPEKQSPDPEELPEKEEHMTLGKFLLRQAIKDGLIDPEQLHAEEKEEKERNETRIHLQAVAEEQPRCRRDPRRNLRTLTTLQKHGGYPRHSNA